MNADQQKTARAIWCTSNLRIHFQQNSPVPMANKMTSPARNISCWRSAQCLCLGNVAKDLACQLSTSHIEFNESTSWLKSFDSSREREKSCCTTNMSRPARATISSRIETFKHPWLQGLHCGKRFEIHRLYQIVLKEGNPSLRRAEAEKSDAVDRNIPQSISDAVIPMARGSKRCVNSGYS